MHTLLDIHDEEMCIRDSSRCCNPVPGDEIVGFVTRGRGLSIHRTDCVNMIHLTEAERARLIPAEWEGNVAEETGGQYLAEIKMYARDQQGLLMSISKVCLLYTSCILLRRQAVTAQQTTVR